MLRKNKSKSNIFLLFFQLMLIGAIIASCSSPATPAATTANTPEATSEGSQSSSSEPVNVRFVILGYSPNTPVLYQEAIDDFQAANPNIKITLENVSWDLAHEKLIGWITSGDVPDISVIGPKWLPELMRLDGLQPFDPYVSQDFLANFPDSLLKPLTFDGKIYSIPEALSTRLMYYRKDLYEKAGFTEPPKTWDDFMKVSKAVNNPPDMYGFSIQGSGDETVWYYSYFMLGVGGYFTDDKGNWALNQPANVEALQYEVELAKTVGPPDVTAIAQETVQGLFTSGKAASYWGPPWTLPAIDQSIRPNVGLADYPTKSGKPAPLFIQDSFALFKNAKHPTEAVKFLEFWNQDKYQVKFNQTESLIPVTNSAGKDPAFANDPALQRFVASIPYARSYPIKDGWETVNVAVREAVQAALLGTDPQKALDDAQAKVENAGYK